MNRLTYFLTIVIVLALFQYSNAQEIALTFDDAPMNDGPVFNGNERTERILKQLEGRQVEQAAFFVVTSAITKENMGRLERYVQGGHLLANHTHRHRWIHELKASGYCQDISVADSILRTMQGFTPYFRYPFLNEGRTLTARDSVRNHLRTLGLSNGYVTVDNYDWYINQLLRKAINEKKEVDYDKLREFYLDHVWQSIEFYDHIAKNTLGRSPRHVLLLHENDLTALFIGDLIDLIKSRGWKIISVEEAYRDPIAAEVPDVLFNGQGRVGAIAFSKGMKAAELVQLSEDEVFLDNAVREKQIFK